jgi:hypothetical protein
LPSWAVWSFFPVTQAQLFILLTVKRIKPLQIRMGKMTGSGNGLALQARQITRAIKLI